MARYVPANAPYNRSSEYIPVPGYMGSYGEVTPDQKKMATYAAVAAAAFGAWWFLKK